LHALPPSTVNAKQAALFSGIAAVDGESRRGSRVALSASGGLIETEQLATDVGHEVILTTVASLLGALATQSLDEGQHRFDGGVSREAFSADE
jgi:phosphate/sulfate permease